MLNVSRVKLIIFVIMRTRSFVKHFVVIRLNEKLCTNAPSKNNFRLLLMLLMALLFKNGAMENTNEQYAEFTRSI